MSVADFFTVIGWLILIVIPGWTSLLSFFCFAGFDSKNPIAGTISGIIALVMWFAWFYFCPLTAE